MDGKAHYKQTQPGEGLVPGKLVLTVLVVRSASVFVIATPPDQTKPDTIDNFWLPSTVLSDVTMADLYREALSLAEAWTGLRNKDMFVDRRGVLYDNLPYPLTAPGGERSGPLFKTAFVRVKLMTKASRNQTLSVEPDRALLEAALEDEEVQFGGSWLSREDARLALDQDMEALRPVRRLFGLEKEDNNNIKNES